MAVRSRRVQTDLVHELRHEPEQGACFYKSPNALEHDRGAERLPAVAHVGGIYGGFSFGPVGANAWPSAFGSLFEIWVPVKTRAAHRPITSQGRSAWLYARRVDDRRLGQPVALPRAGRLRERRGESRRPRAPYVYLTTHRRRIRSGATSAPPERRPTRVLRRTRPDPGYLHYEIRAAGTSGVGAAPDGGYGARLGALDQACDRPSRPTRTRPRSATTRAPMGRAVKITWDFTLHGRHRSTRPGRNFRTLAGAEATRISATSAAASRSAEPVGSPLRCKLERRAQT